LSLAQRKAGRAIEGKIMRKMKENTYKVEIETTFYFIIHQASVGADAINIEE